MNEIIIKINWIYFLGIMGALISIAWYSSSRFSRVETDVDWIKKLLNGLKIDFGNKDVEAFKQNSPVELTDKGQKLFIESGLKKYIDDKKKSKVILDCKAKKDINNAYDVQGYIFNLMDNLEFEGGFSKKIKEYSYKQGVGIELMRRIGGIYLRNICLEEMGLNKKDIDNHNIKEEK